MADDSPIDSFLVEIGFSKPDAANARAQEDLVQRTETRITDIQARESAKRTEAESKAQSSGLGRLAKYIEDHARLEAQSRERRAVATAQALGELMGLDKEQSLQMLKHLREGNAKFVELEKDKVKRVAVVHNEQFKQLEAQAFRVASVLTGLGTGLGVALSATPFGAFLMGVERTASGLSNLAVQSQRVGASASGIQRFLFSMRRQGVDEGQATGALEGFASTMKNNPEGYRQALARFGVKTIGPDGKPLDNDELLENFGQKLATEPLNIARIHAGQFGITGDDAINALRNPEETRRGLRAYDDKLSSFGFDPNKAAEDVRKVQQSWDNLEADFRIIKQKLDAEFFLPMMNSLDALAKKLEENPQVVENYGRAFEAMAIGVSARVLPVLTNLAVKLSGLAPILGTSLGTAVGIAVNPVVALGASAESTPGAGIPADAAERAKVAAENQRLTEEANKRQGSTGSFWQDSWTYIKGKLGFGEDQKVKADIATTAEATRKLADKADGLSTPGGGAFGGAAESSGGLGGSGRHAGGGSGQAGAGVISPGAAMADRAHGGHGHGGGAGPADPSLPVGNAPGASGYGLINAYWKGSLDKRGEGNHTGPKEMFDYLKSQGASDNEALLLTGSAASESSFNPNAVHDGGTGHGLFGHKDTRLDMRGKNWQQQSMLALGELRRTLGGRVNAARTPEELTDIEMHNERPRGYKPGNPRAGDNYMGRLNSIRRFSVLTGRPTAQAPVPTGTSEQAVTDGEVFAARQRLAAGGRDPKDIALRDRYLRQQNGPSPPPHPDDDRISRARPSDVRYGARGFLSPLQATSGGGDNALTHLYKDGALKVEVTKPLPGLANLKGIHELIAKHAAAGTLMPRSVHPLVSPGFINTIHHGNRSHFERHGDTFNIHGTDAKRGLDEAVKVSARRESQDRVRYGQG